MKKHRFHALILGTLLVCSTSAAQEDLPLRGPDYFKDTTELAGILGAAHAIRVRCNGRDDQYWRRYMADMLSYEAPDRGTLRASMVESFNDAYSRISKQFESCDQRAIDAEGRYARQGQAIASRLSTHYFPKRRSRMADE